MSQLRDTSSATSDGRLKRQEGMEPVRRLSPKSRKVSVLTAERSHEMVPFSSRLPSRTRVTTPLAHHTPNQLHWPLVGQVSAPAHVLSAPASAPRSAVPNAPSATLVCAAAPSAKSSRQQASASSGAVRRMTAAAGGKPRFVVVRAACVCKPSGPVR